MLDGPFAPNEWIIRRHARRALPFLVDSIARRREFSPDFLTLLRLKRIGRWHVISLKRMWLALWSRSRAAAAGSWLRCGGLRGMRAIQRGNLCLERGWIDAFASCRWPRVRGGENLRERRPHRLRKLPRVLSSRTCLR